MPDRDRNRLLTLRRLLHRGHADRAPHRPGHRDQAPHPLRRARRAPAGQVLAEFGLDGPRHPDRHWVRMMSFSQLAVQRMRQLCPAVPAGLPRRSESVPLRFRDGSLPRGVDTVGPRHQDPAPAPRDVVSASTRHGHQVYVWTVDDPADVGCASSSVSTPSSATVPVRSVDAVEATSARLHPHDQEPAGDAKTMSADGDGSAPVGACCRPARCPHRRRPRRRAGSRTLRVPWRPTSVGRVRAALVQRPAVPWRAAEHRSTRPRSSSPSCSPTPSGTPARCPTAPCGCTGRSRTASSRSRSPTAAARPRRARRRARLGALGARPAHRAQPRPRVGRHRGPRRQHRVGRPRRAVPPPQPLTSAPTQPPDAPACPRAD